MPGFVSGLSVRPPASLRHGLPGFLGGAFPFRGLAGLSSPGGHGLAGPSPSGGHGLAGLSPSGGHAAAAPHRLRGSVSAGFSPSGGHGLAGFFPSGGHGLAGFSPPGGYLVTVPSLPHGHGVAGSPVAPWVPVGFSGWGCVYLGFRHLGAGIAGNGWYTFVYSRRPCFPTVRLWQRRRYALTRPPPRAGAVLSNRIKKNGKISQKQIGAWPEFGHELGH
jgi:hypothetical protein